LKTPSLTFPAQGSQVKTNDRARAEIDLRRQYTAPHPNTTVQFSTLGSNDSGRHISVVNLVEGMAYVNWLGKDEVTLNFCRGSP
jgi:hypothetical protein